MNHPETSAQADTRKRQSSSWQRGRKRRRRSNRRHRLCLSKETYALEELRARHPDRVISWTVPTYGHRGGWLALSFALTDSAYRDVGLLHAVWAPTAEQLAGRIAVQDALAAGVATAMNLHPSAHHSGDQVAGVRARLAPLARDVAVRVLCQRSGI